MKKATLLLALILISTNGFSQDRVTRYRLANISLNLKTLYASNNNLENTPINKEINKLELEYLNLKAKEVHDEFENQDLSKLKTENEFFKEYIAYLKKKIADSKKPEMLKRDDKLKYFSVPRVKKLDDKEKTELDLNGKGVGKAQTLINKNEGAWARIINIMSNNPDWNIEKQAASRYFSVSKDPKKPIELTKKEFEKIQLLQRCVMQINGFNEEKIFKKKSEK